MNKVEGEVEVEVFPGVSPNSRQFPKPPLVYPRNYCRNSTLMTRHYPEVTRSSPDG